MQKIILTVCGVIIIIFIILNIFFPQKDNSELQEIVNQENVLLVDVRTPEEFGEGNVKGSINIPVDSIEQNLDKFRNQEQIVVFCKSGKRSTKAKSILEEHGFTNIINGGSWQDINALVKNKR